jgi:hypothetical protein
LNLLDRKLGELVFGHEAAEELDRVFVYFARNSVKRTLPALEVDRTRNPERSAVLTGPSFFKYLISWLA